MISYKQVVKDLRNILDNHQQISSNGFGDLTQLTMDVETEQEPFYVRVYVIPNTVSLTNGQIQYSFNVVCADIVNSDLSNLQDILSDTELILIDIFNKYKNYITENFFDYQDYDVLYGSTLIPFTEKSETTLAGWTMNLTVVTKFPYNECIIPTDFDFTDENYKSYKLFLSDLKSFAISHPQINSYGFGDIYQMTNDIETDKEPFYMKMYVSPGTKLLEQGQIQTNFSVIFSDIVNSDYTNQLDVLSDTLQSYIDFYTKLKHVYFDMADINLEPFLEDYETTLAGWSSNIPIDFMYNYSDCFTPIEISPTPTPTINTSPTPSPTPSLTPSISITPTLTPSISISPTPSISITPTPTITPSPSQVSEAPLPAYTTNLVINLIAGRNESYPDSGDTWYDIEGSRDFNLVNSPTFNTGSLEYFTFNGTNQYSNNSSLFGSNSDSYTFGVWIKYNENGNDEVFIVRGIGTDYSLVLQKNTDDQFEFIHRNFLGGITRCKTTGTFNDGQWYYVAGIWDRWGAETLRIYINGNLEATQPVSTLNLYETTSGWGIARYNLNNYHVDIAELQIYYSGTGVVSESNLLDNFNAQKSYYGY